MKDLFGQDVHPRSAARSVANRNSAERAAKWRNTPDYQRWLVESRDRRRQLKEKYRRQRGVKTLAQRKQEAVQRKQDAAQRKSTTYGRHDAHVNAWRKARSGDAYTHAYRNDPVFNAKEKLRTQLRKLKHADSDIYRLMSNTVKKGGWLKAWTDQLGYSFDELVAHLKRTLPHRATWEDFMHGRLHIDHIVPRDQFDLSDVAEVTACWRLSNLRLLWAKDNQAKHKRREFLL